MLPFKDQRFLDISLLVLGFLGAVWFFVDMENYHPLSIVEINLDEERAISTADSLFHFWEYQQVNLKKRAYVEADNDLIDRIQSAYGRKNYLLTNDSENYRSLPLYRWAVDQFLVTKEGAVNAVSFELSKEGELLSVNVDNDIVSEQRPSNRKLIRAGFGEITGYNIQREDSIITNLLDFQHMGSSSLDGFEILLMSDEHDQGNFVWQGAEWYLNNSYWKRFNFRQDSLVFDDDGQVRYAQLKFISTDTLMGVIPEVNIELLPAGVIRKMSYNLINDIPSANEISTTKINLISGFVLTMIVWLLFSFYLRIKARALDTRPALIISILTGFSALFLSILALIKNLNVNYQAEEIATLFSQILQFGVIGALTAVSFFVVTAVSDSVTRQYWPLQLKTWDLVRRGMFKNKPVGLALLRAICIGCFMIGVYTVLIQLFPEAYISGNINFLNDEFILSPVANTIRSFLYALGMVVIVFLILGNQFYAKTGKRWVIPLVGAITFGFTNSFSITINPEIYGVLIQAFIGLMLGIFYVRFDFITTAIGFFVFANFLSTIPGWIVTNSPDESSFIGFLLLLTLSLGVSIYFLFLGEDKDRLPEYIPEYLEDQAREQRVQQELDIARNVQETFLPEKTPEITGFDTSAICIPAQETGGDYYDIIRLNEEKVAFTIGDVSGKGIQAAFYMTFIKGVIHSLCSIFLSPKQMMFHVNKLFSQNATRGTFISMIYGVLDLSNRSFTYVRAGHNPILFKKADDSIEWLQPVGVGVGMANEKNFDKVFQEDEIILHQGDVLILYTDGITEAQNEEKEFYDEKRLQQLIITEKMKSAKELRDLIIEDVRTFAGSSQQSDDMTLVVIKG